MACYHLIDCWQTVAGKIVFSERGDIKRALRLPCGQCIGCRLERSRQWAVRCVHECQMHAHNSFVTLTYDDAHLLSVSLIYRDFQLFMKRLRKAVGPCSFYMCGEYGEVCDVCGKNLLVCSCGAGRVVGLGRPHFHACLFGVEFADRVVYQRLDSGCFIYRSALLERLWPCGFASVGDVTFDSAAYVARYVMKKVTGDDANAHYVSVSAVTGEIVDRVPEFARMSLRPGIGKRWIEKYFSDVYPEGEVVVGGRKMKPPRYYDEYFRGLDGLSADELDFDRYLKSLETLKDNTAERLAAREVVTRARLSFKKRGFV